MILQHIDTLNGLGEKLTAAFAQREAIQDKVYLIDNPKTDNFPNLLERSGVLDKYEHLGRWSNQEFGRGNRGYCEYRSYFLLPLMVIEKVTHLEMLRMLPLHRTRYASTRELLAFLIQNRRAVRYLLRRQHYRIHALASDDFNLLGCRAPYLRWSASSVVLDRLADTPRELWGARDLILLRYPSRS